jgi:hypothetical protein
VQLFGFANFLEKADVSAKRAEFYFTTTLLRVMRPSISADKK